VWFRNIPNAEGKIITEIKEKISYIYKNKKFKKIRIHKMHMHKSKPLRRVDLWLPPEISPDDLDDPAVLHMLDKWQRNMYGTIVPVASHVYGNSHLATSDKKELPFIFLNQ
jgi:hypothetical protein